MKKFITAVMLTATISLGAFAAEGTKKIEDDSKNVSYFVLNQFAADFSEAKNINWTITSTTQKADFTEDGVKKTAFYSLSGTYLGVTETVKYKAVPTAAQKTIAEDYEGYEVAQVIKFVANDVETGASYQGMAIGVNEPVNYFIDLKKGNSEILVRATQHGSVYFFKEVK